MVKTGISLIFPPSLLFYVEAGVQYTECNQVGLQLFHFQSRPDEDAQFSGALGTSASVNVP